MKLTYLKSASVVIEHNGIKILCDPWLVDGEYYGSWYHYPPVNFKIQNYDDVDYIYISHIHLDHFSPKTLKQMNKKIPIIILKYIDKFLKNNLERLGFKVIELEHNLRTPLKGNLHIRILAADYCNPELCGIQTGCSIIEKKYGATHIDSMCVIDNDEKVIVNTNDCPFELAKTSASDIMKNYKKIDLLLVGYAGAGPYPQCFEMLNKSEKNIAAEKKKKQFFKQAEDYINLLNPKYFMPFAGRYTLAGKLSSLNNIRGVPEIEEAFDFFNTKSDIDKKKSKCFLLNSEKSFDLNLEYFSDPYIPIDINEKNKYVNQHMSIQKFDYENEFVENEELEMMISLAYQRFERKRKEINFKSKCQVLLPILDNKCVIISLNGEGYRICLENEIPQIDYYVKFTVDPRLLKWILKGPKFAHWNNAEVGSHIKFDRHPNIFERGVYHCMGYFHS
jgi:UDP-MurNAc hydroxylase